MTVMLASPNCRVWPWPVPADDHPLRPLVAHYNTLRDLVIAADLECERLAPTPDTLAGDHPADALTGQRLDYYLHCRQKREDFAHAADMLHTALAAAVDNLGGM